MTSIVVIQGKEILNASQHTLAGVTFEFQVELLMVLKLIMLNCATHQASL